MPKVIIVKMRCFIAYQFLNYLKTPIGSSYTQMHSILDKMQLSVIEQYGELEPIYMRSATNEYTTTFTKTS